MNAAAPTPNMAVDLARRTLVQGEPIALSANEGRVRALATIAGDVKGLSTGFDFTADEVREALVAQQVAASADVWGLADIVKPEHRSSMSFAAQQTLAKAIAASGDLSEGSVVRQAVGALPDALRLAVPIEAQVERSAHRPS